MNKRRIFNKIDKPLLFITLICLIFGLMAVGSASSLKAYMSRQDSYYFLKRQLLFSLVGVFLGYVVIKIPIKKYKRAIYFAVLAIIGMLIYVLVNAEVVKGITGWINFGAFNLQPSEFAKTVTILYLALSFEKLMKLKQVGMVRKFIPFLIPLVFMALIFKQPDFGTMLVVFGICVTVFILVPYDRKSKFIITIFSIVSILIVVLAMVITGKGLTKNQLDRFNYKAPCTRYRQKTGYQVCNGYIAINSGGLLGNGFGNSKQKFLYLPEAHTDFIFAIVIEELGFVSGLVILIAYFILIWRIILIAKNSYNIQGMIICYGVATYISLHIIINLGGVLGLIPLTGIPLPFYTYGGSFMINLLVALALVQRVCIENKLFEQRNLVR